MTHRLAICLAIASSLLVAPRPAAATTFSHVFNTVDAVEAPGSSHLAVTGILAGQTAPTTEVFAFWDPEHAQRCERLALLAMSKPGRYQFRIGLDPYSTLAVCKLIRVTP